MPSPEEVRAIIDPALKVMMEAVHHYDGHLAQSTSDDVFALFGTPVACEDHPQRALYAALRLQEAIRKYSAKAVRMVFSRASVFGAGLAKFVRKHGRSKRFCQKAPARHTSLSV
jgi:class 3 adenylate cyclase